MIKLRTLAALAVLTASLAAGRASADCTVSKMAELPVTMTGMRAMVPAKINGADASFFLDSGAFYSLISPANAARYQLNLEPLSPWYRLNGLGGDTGASITRVKEFTLLGVPMHNIEFLVGGSENNQYAAGVLGQNILGIADVEYDLANGAVRLMKVRGCQNKSFAYWAPSAPYSELHIDTGAPNSPRIEFTKGTAYVNGVRINVAFDTGAISMLSLSAAKRAGINTTAAGVVEAEALGGIGRHNYPTWIAPVDRFKIGDEEIQHTHLRIAATDIPGDVDMLIGVDFFLSHRIFVANSQNKMYFTYNGGPVFDLTTNPAAEASAHDAATSAADPKTDDTASTPKTADGFARRGAAFIDRHDFDKAIADLTRATELAPAEADYFYQRATAYAENSQPFLAMADIDQALKLKPDNIPALMFRAQLRISGHDKAHALSDLDAVDRLAAKEADIRLPLAGLYERIDAMPAAIAQYDLWIKTHPEDSNAEQAHARNGRCWARALTGQDLTQALADCDKAHKLEPKGAAILDSRGLVHLRRSEFDLAIADYDAALATNPKLEWSLYGRGIAKLRKGLSTEGQADIAAALAIDPKLADEAKGYGVTP